MVPEREINGLLQTLQRLYSWVTSRVLEKRMDSYREESGTGIAHNLDTLLSDHIDRIADTKAASGEGTQGHVSVQKVQSATHNLSLGRRHSDHQTSIVSKTLSGLGRYFRSKPTETALDPELSKKLKQSTWHHIHAALRLARQGDARTAKLHLEIASQALKEAGHYMSREEHIAFRVEIEEKLGEITAQNTDYNL